VLALLVVGCRSGATGADSERPEISAAASDVGAPAPQPSTLLAAVFDSVVTAELVFPEAQQRALYRVVPPETREHKRVYGFELKPQPGMQRERHFHIVSISVASATGSIERGPSTLAGPTGAFNEVWLRTGDARYELSVSDGNLLPESVEVPAFDLTSTARRISERYAALRD
jgi:hypothetical protein